MEERSLSQLETPCAVLDLQRMERNIQRLRSHVDGLGVSLRPHLKTSKSVECARRVMSASEGPATVSTLKEAQQFIDAGVTDLMYGVGIEPTKLDRVIAMRATGVDITVILDSVEQAEIVAQASKANDTAVPALIEIDSDGHRSGVQPDEAERLVAIGRTLSEGGELRGVMAHAGGSYGSRGAKALAQYAEKERHAVVTAATTLRDAGLSCPVVSVGSTPTAHFAQDLEGVTEVRAGVFMFFDLVMAGIDVCRIDDIALSVMATVIGHQKEKGWIIVDAGWMAMSRDRGTAKQEVDQGYGVVCDMTGAPYADLIVADGNQEHGILAIRPGSDAVLPEMQVGDRVRILPNHACATGAQHDRYQVVRGASQTVEAEWSRFGAW